MKKTMFTKLVLTALVGSMILASCGNGSSSEGEGGSASSGSSTTATSNEPYELPLVTDGSVTISIASYENYLTGYNYSDGLPVWQKYEEDTGVKIDWQMTPISDYVTVMQTRLAAGEDLPDFMNVPGSAMQYVEDGLFISLTEQLDKNGYYTRQFYEANPYVKPFVTGPDGEIYFFTNDVAGTSLADPYTFMIREDWLEKFGLKDPETLDDWYNCWKTFLEEDANGNGQRDEIPFCNDNTLQGVLSFGEAYGLYLHASGGWSVGTDGKVTYDYIKPEAKELLTWLNKCYTEGLLDKEFATQNSDTIMKKVSSNQSGGVFRFLNGLDTYNKALASAGIDGSYKVVKPPKSSADSDTEPFVERYGPIVDLYGFTKDCEDLDIKFKFVDYFYASEAGNRGTCFGVEGTSYEVKDGKPVFTDFVLNNPDGMGTNSALRSLGAMPTLPWNRSLNGYWSYQAPQTIAHNPNTVAAAEMMQDYIHDSFPTSILLTSDEQAIITQYAADLETRSKEMMTRFIMGQESLDNFDKFVSELEAMGLAEVTAIRQSQYDRYIAGQK